MVKTFLDMINAIIVAEQNPITLAEFTRIRNEGTPEEIEEAVQKMEAMGGYENLV